MYKNNHKKIILILILLALSILVIWFYLNSFKPQSNVSDIGKADNILVYNNDIYSSNSSFEESLSGVINYNENGSPAKYKEVYDESKVLPSNPDSTTTKKMNGYIYNQMYIRLHVNYNEPASINSRDLLEKNRFNEWLSKKTNLKFKNLTIDNKLSFSYWLIEFPDASQSEMKKFETDISLDKEVYYISYINTILPQYNTPENILKMSEENVIGF